MSEAAKSGLNNQFVSSNGSQSILPQSQHLKQTNKNNIERDYSRENVQSAQGQPIYQQNFQKIEKQPPFQTNSISQQQSKRSLAKSLSQNRLLLVSPETILNSNNAYNEMGNDGNNQDKNSFSEQSLGCRGGNPSQELLFKQHLQYSSNHANSHTHQQNAWQLKAKSHILSHMSTKECTYCNKTLGVNSNSHIPPYCSAIYCIKDSLGMMIQNNLSKKYSTNRDYYNLKIVNDLIYNENTHIVSIFKDYLILDDINEFLKRSYTQQETKVRLPKLCSFYDKYSQVFPNYVILPESKYMFKNIQRKQKLIDEQYQLQEELAKKQHQTLLDDDRLFNSKFYNSVYRMDISMSRQQYEDQAKSIATVAGRPQKQPLRIDQMKIDELVDRFLLKDSESNIQLITTAGLDFSGFTMHGQSTIIHDKHQQNHTPNKQVIAQSSSNKASVVQQQQAKVNQQIMMIQKNSQAVGQRKESLQQKKSSIQPQKEIDVKKTKGSFNNQQRQQQQNVPKLETQPKFNTNNSSQKTTPRLQKSTPYTVEDNKQLVQTSPGTKEALQNYLSNCQIDDMNSNNMNDLHLELAGNMPLKYENHILLQSPQFTIQKLLAQNSQTALSQQMPGNSLGSNNRQHIKSQCAIPTMQFNQTMPKQDITNLKKTTRLSSGNLGQQKQTATAFNNHPINKKQNASPNPGNAAIQSQQQLTASSRNIVNNQTQKSFKSVNSHAKYLSGGVDQYQRLLSQQNAYTTHETVHSNQFGSSSKKLQPNHISKQDVIMDTFQSKQTMKNNFINDGDQGIDNDGAVTGEDCDDCGIADERFASPDIFTTNDDVIGRKSINHRQQINTGGGFGNPILLTSCEDNRILSQCNNYDQIKKHLEQYITISQQESGKKYIQTMSNEKIHIEKQIFPSTGTNAQNQQDMNNSRNGTAQKHFESLKQKIRGVFEVDGSITASANKTPNKSSTHSKKSHINQQPSIMQQNRMSIESKDMMLMVGHPQNAGCLSSTSAAGRTLSFAQFNNNQANNYRSITNMQQRKNSSHKQETSVESKRLSQNRQSFKEMQNEKIKRSATGKTLSINDINQHTFGNIQNSSGTPYLQQIASSTTLGNPTFIQAQNPINKASYQTHHQQQNSIQNSSHVNNSQSQAAGQVRVMTPSYSLASLSKIISPTQSTSPITMTVTLASQARKQPIKKQVATHQMSHHQHNPSTLVTSSSHQNFIISDKNNKMISSQSKQQQSNTIQSKSNRSIANQQQFNQTKQIAQKNLASKPLQQSSSQENVNNVTPRGFTQQLQQPMQKQPQFENSQNLSCTISTENNSSKTFSDFILILAKAIESKNPKFMKTIEEYSNQQQVTQQYNNMLSASLGHRKSGTGLSATISQADLKQKQKIQTVVNSNQASIKRANNQLMGSTQVLSSSASVSHFKSPSQQIQSKKQGNRYV